MSSLHSRSPPLQHRQRRKSSPPTAIKTQHTRQRASLSIPHRQVRHRLSSSSSSPDLRAASVLHERSSGESLLLMSDSDEPLTPFTEPHSDNETNVMRDVLVEDQTKRKSGNVKTTLLTQDDELLDELSKLSKMDKDAQSGASYIQKVCCGGGCCKITGKQQLTAGLSDFKAVELPDNPAFESLKLNVSKLSLDSELTGVHELPVANVSFSRSPTDSTRDASTVQWHPPTFVQPHPPYSVHSAPLYHARQLTKPGAEKRTFHFDIDVSDYPEEGGTDFKVGGAVGVCPPNLAEDVEAIFDILGTPKFLRDKQIMLHTIKGTWPTIWGADEPHLLPTTRRELLTWCVDIQSYPPTKNLLRVLAEHATHPDEKKILMFLCSAEGQAAFCNLRSGPHLTLIQLLNAFPSSRPPLEDLMANLQQLMPRFYSLSNDPHVSAEREGLAGRRIIEIAVTVHETPNWKGPARTGVGSGFFERLALKFIEAEKNGTLDQADLRVPLFRGLMANPLSKEFKDTNGPMVLIGAGVGMAPFRGFILNRLKSANCANKIWLVQGVRNSDFDELYQGELGKYEHEIKRVVQSRRPGMRTLQSSIADQPHLKTSLNTSHSEADLSQLRISEEASRRAEKTTTRWRANAQLESKYVQDEVRQQADVVWDVINAADGRVFVCGSSKGMGEGVEEALRDIALMKGGFGPEGAKEFWEGMKAAGKYISETW